ncbi:MAG: molecular chaperone HtpG [Gammaproteobacteria bacterium]
MTSAAQRETRQFETENEQILHLVTHSLYSNKEIFLRELISNASDALDKLRFSALSKNELYENDPDLKIQIKCDETAKTITIIDNGIGMSRDEAIEHLGMIAKSGTREFLAQLSGDQSKDSQLIGQFGVGFYSAFIVADQVTVKTRRAGLKSAEGVLWTSKGGAEYNIETIEKATRGTEITLHFNKDSEEFLSDWRLRSIITKYSDHINWPILMAKPPAPEEGDGDKKDKDSETKVAEKAPEQETVNRATALWALQKNEVTDEQYKELYKHISHDFQDPLAWTHNHVEGKQHYISLLYIPAHAPFDLWQQEVKHGLKLYVKRVFIMDEASQFLPRYLRFIKGVIDSSDLPLNISREILQDNKLVENIRASCVKRTLDVLDRMVKNDPEQYAKFWAEFGLVLKEGPIEDFSNRERIAKLLRFSSTHDDNETPKISLQDYVSRMHKDQEKIYYITASSFNTAKHSPHLEVFRDKSIEVLLLHDRVDEWLVSHLSEFDGRPLQSVTKGELDIKGIEKTEQEKQDDKKVEDEYDSLVKQVKSVLGEQVKEVRITHRLTTSPACVVVDDSDMSSEMQRILQSSGQEVPITKPIFELNPKHLLLERLKNETDDDRFAEMSRLLFDQAVLAEGGKLDDPAQFVNRMNTILLELAK